MCQAQKEVTPEDSKAAAGYYRDVCIPAWKDKWDALVDEIDARYDWMDDEAERIAAREKARKADLEGKD